MNYSNSLRYAAEKASGALHLIATHPSGNVRDRIYDAWVGLMPAQIDAGVAADTQELFDRIAARITRNHRIETVGTLGATLAVMGDVEARQLMGALVALCEAIIVERSGGTPNPQVLGYLPPLAD